MGRGSEDKHVQPTTAPALDNPAAVDASGAGELFEALHEIVSDQQVDLDTAYAIIEVQQEALEEVGQLLQQLDVGGAIETLVRNLLQE